MNRYRPPPRINRKVSCCREMGSQSMAGIVRYNRCPLPVPDRHVGWRYNRGIDSPPGVKSLALFQQPDDDRARAALAATAVGMAILDTEGSWQHANPALVRLLDGAPGAPCPDGAGNLFDVVDPAEAAALRAEVASLLSGGAESIDRGILCRRGAGPFTARINLAVLRDDAGGPDGLVLQLQPDAGADAADE